VIRIAAGVSGRAPICADSRSCPRVAAVIWDREAPRAPAPSISRLDKLVVRAAGMEVTAQVEQRGAARPLPPGVDLAAYRILGEALTNLTRHSRAMTAREGIAICQVIQPTGMSPVHHGRTS
jgi:hypothetical protein